MTPMPDAVAGYETDASAEHERVAAIEFAIANGRLAAQCAAAAYCRIAYERAQDRRPCGYSMRQADAMAQLDAWLAHEHGTEKQR